MHRVLAVVVTVAALLTATACSFTFSSSNCSGNVCTINISGEQTVEVDFGSFERDLQVTQIDPGGVTVVAGGHQARLAVGQTSMVADLIVTLTSLSGRDVGLEIREA